MGKRKSSRNALSKSALRAALSIENADRDRKPFWFESAKDSKEDIKEEGQKTTEESIIESICSKYLDGETVKQISKELDSTEYKIKKILIDNNIEIRPRGYNLKSKFREKELSQMGETDEIIETKEVSENVEESTDINEDIKETTEIIEEPVENTNTVDDNKDEKKLSTNSIVFCNREIKDDKLSRVEFNMFDNDIFIAGLVKDRHEIPFVNKFVFNTLTEKQFADPEYAEAKAKGFLNYYVRPKPTEPPKTLVVYCTGLQLALSALVSACAQLKVNLITMHYNPDTRQYMPQNTLTIFGKVPDISKISPLKLMEKTYNDVFTYNCSVKDLVATEDCMYIALHDDVNNNKSIILFNKDFPDDTAWNLFGECIKIMKSDDVATKKHNVMMGNIIISLAGYNWCDNICKSYNYKRTK